MALINDNERLKLVAAAFDRLSTAVLTVGVVAPAINLVYGTSAIASERLIPAFWAWVFLAGLLHLLGQYALGGLR